VVYFYNSANSHQIFVKTKNKKTKGDARHN